MKTRTRDYFAGALIVGIIAAALLIGAMNKIMLVAVAAGAAAQLGKALTCSVRARRFLPLAFFEIAGMPSGHTATTVAITTAIYLATGPSNLFVFCLVVSGHVVHDLLTHERVIERHAERINALLRLLPIRLRYEPLIVQFGHSPSEVLIGGLLGYGVARLVWLWPI